MTRPALCAFGQGDRRGVLAWWAVCAAIGLMMLALPAAQQALGGPPPATLFDWQPTLAWPQAWRWWTPVAVHYSPLHWGANLAGLLLVGALGQAAQLPRRAALAWCLAWPLTHLALGLRPELLHYGGASGVLHAGVAVVGVVLLCWRQGTPRWIGAALWAGLLLKLGVEAPWGPVLQARTGWDILIAPWAHATGTAAGALCAGLVAAVWRPRPRP
ncbi:MAG: rhomboid family intramembrane serine protease [Pseudomonadota bacterium]